MRGSHVAVDLGTTNTVLAKWDEAIQSPEIIRIDGICRGADKRGEIDDSYTIPSCLYLLYPEEYLGFPQKHLFRKFKRKTGGLIGMEAIVKDGGLYSPRFVNFFKPYLGRNSYQIIGKLGRWSYTAEDAARVFLKALFFNAGKKLRSKIREVTFCVPVDFYEFYRAKLRRVCADLSVRSVKTIDEPVAAALGYGLGLDSAKNILVVDFGAGTLDLALIRMEEKTGDAGKCAITAKEGVPMGGNVVDGWIVEEICRRFGYDYARISRDPDIRWWYRMLLAEACRVKESLFLNEVETFFLMPSGLLEQYALSPPCSRDDLKRPMDVSRDDLKKILAERGLYSLTENLLDSVASRQGKAGPGGGHIDDVLLVGGSTLLPGFYSLVEKKFGRDRVRAWQPFNAVAFGAAAFAAGKINKSDHITHDYAFVTHHRTTHEPEYNVIVPRGTPFPTPPEFWKRQLVPTCALGEPEQIFKLSVCEIGKKHGFGQEFIWDEKGELHSVGDDGKETPLIIPLNESDPTLGYLSPPHLPSERTARIELSFMVNEDKWLCASVLDLKTGKRLMQERPVIRLK